MTAEDAAEQTDFANTVAGGLYWVTAAVAMGFASAMGNAWVLVVDIKR